MPLTLASLSSRSYGCAVGGPDCEETCHSIFMPEITGRETDAPFYVSVRPFYGIGYKPTPNFDTDNVAEWSKAFRGSLSNDEIQHVVYKMKIEQIDALIFALKGQTSALDASAKNIFKKLNQGEYKKFATKSLYYLGFAKRVEPLTTGASDAWADNPEKTTAQTAPFAKLIEGGEVAANSVEDPFLEARYRFQILRLYFYNKQNRDVVAYFDQHAPVFDRAGNSIKFRSLDLVIGALSRLKEVGRANYLSSVLFTSYKPLKLSAYLAFSPRDEKDWQETIAMTKNTGEREVVYHLFGLHGHEIDAIEKIFQINPKSPYLNLLLVRAVNKAEREIVIDPKKPLPGRDLAIIKNIADGGQTEKPFLWDLSLAHLYALNRDTDASAKYLDRTRATAPKVKLVADQIRMTTFFNRINNLSTPNGKDLDYFTKELTWLMKQEENERAINLFDRAMGRLSTHYMKKGQYVWALMLNDRHDDEVYQDDAKVYQDNAKVYQDNAKVYQDNAKVDRIIALIQAPKKSSFETFMVKHYQTTVSELIEIKGINLLYAGSYQAAAKMFATVPQPNVTLKILADPFLARNVDCHDCDIEKGTSFNKLTFAAQMAELEVKTKATGEDAARSNFEFATGLYNMSYFGNGRSIYNTRLKHFEDALDRNRNMSRPKEHYLRAANLSQDSEFKARAIFMAAKCELNRHNDETVFNRKRGWYDKEGGYFAGKNFQSLKASFKETKFFQEVIQECGYFKTFVSRP